MPRLSVQHCLTNFETALRNAMDLLTESNSYRILQNDGHYFKLGARRKELFASLALLRMQLAWENFIEDVFVRYMCGATTASGFSPALIVIRSRNTTEAMNRLLNGNLYLNWSSRNIENRSRQYFAAGEPFIPVLGTVRNTLNDINIIRNRFAHQSEYSVREFNTTVQSLLGYIPRGINSGRLLLMDDPAYPTIKLIDRYSNTFLVTARNLVP